MKKVINSVASTLMKGAFWMFAIAVSLYVLRFALATFGLLMGSVLGALVMGWILWAIIIALVY